MALTERNAPWREQKSCALCRQKKGWLLTLWLAVRPRPRTHIAGLSAYYLRDIGMDQADIEHLRHRHPSQHIHHPRG